MLLPVAYLVYHALTATDDVEKLLGPFVLARLGRTLTLGLGVTTIVVLLSATLAWLTVRTNLKFRGLIGVLLVTPLAVPPYVTAYALLSVGGDDGLLVRWLGQDFPPLAWWFTDEQTGQFHLPRISGFIGSLIALSAYNLPYVYLPLRAALLGADASLEDASRSLGRGKWRTLFFILGPQLLPALLAGSLLVALHVVADFGVVSLMRYDTLSASLYARYNAFDLGNASRLGLLLVALASLLVVMEWLILRPLRLQRAGIGVARQSTTVKLGPWQGPALLLCSGVVLAGSLLPAIITLYWMSHLPDLWAAGASVLQAALGSISASLPAAVIAVVLAVPVAVLSERYPGRWSAAAQRLPLVAYAVPGLAFGLSLIMIFTARWMPDALYRMFYQSLPLLVLAYVFHFLAEAVGPIRSSLKLTSPRLEEAGRSLGSTAIGSLRRITLPIMRHGLIVGLALVFLSCMKELPLTMLLSPLGLETLARNAWDHTENADFANAAPYALAILLSSCVFVGLLLLEKRDPRP